MSEKKKPGPKLRSRAPREGGVLLTFFAPQAIVEAIDAEAAARRESRATVARDWLRVMAAASKAAE